jgi:hypothetical protein
MTDIGVGRDNSVEVNIVIEISQVQSRNFGLPLFVTPENTPEIDQLERVRAYNSLEDVAEDWNTTDEAYKMAQTFFSQEPKPETCLIGVRFTDDEPGFVELGTVGDISHFQGVTDGSFKITIDEESEQNIKGLDFSQSAGYLLCLPLVAPLSLFQQVTDGSFNVTVDGGSEQEIENIDLSATPAKLICSNTGLMASFQLVENGDFKISFEGEEYNITDLDFRATPAELECASPPGKLSDFQAVTDGSFQLDIDGLGGQQITGLDFHATAGKLIAFPITLEDNLINFQDVGSGGFSFTLNGVQREVTNINTVADAASMASQAASAGALANFQAIINGEFKITISGVGHNVIGLNFTSPSVVASLTEVAARINSAMDTQGIEATCTIGEEEQFFVFRTIKEGSNATLQGLTAAGQGGNAIEGSDYLNCESPLTLQQGYGPNNIQEVIDQGIQPALDKAGIEIQVTLDTDKFVFTSELLGSSSSMSQLSPPETPGQTDISGENYINGQNGSTFTGIGPSSLEDIALNYITPALPSGSCEYDVVGEKFIFLTSAKGEAAYVSELSAADSGTDISGATGTVSKFLNGALGKFISGTGPSNYYDLTELISEKLPGDAECDFDIDHFVFTSEKKGEDSSISYLMKADVSNTDISTNVYLNGREHQGASKEDGTGPDNFPEIADIITEKLTGAVCTFHTDHFVITSATYGPSSSVSKLSSGVSGVDIAGSLYLNGINGHSKPGGSISSYYEIAHIIGAKLKDATCQYKESPYKHFKIVSNSKGDDSKVSLLGKGSGTTDLSAEKYMNGSNAEVVKIVQGHTYKSITDELSEIMTANDSAFFLSFTKETRDNKDVEDIAAYVKALSLPHQFFTVSNNPLLLDASVSTDIASKLKTLLNNTTWVQYSSYADEYPEVSVLGRACTVDFNGLTLKFKKLPGITPETRNSSPQFNSSKLSVVNSKNANAYSVEMGGNVIVSNSKMSSGNYQDDLHGMAWLTDSIQVNITDLFHTENKVAYTNPGVALIVGELIESLEQAITNGMSAPAEETTGDVKLPYSITVKRVENVSQQDKEERLYPGIEFTMILGGAIHRTIVNGTLTLP